MLLSDKAKKATTKDHKDIISTIFMVMLIGLCSAPWFTGEPSLWRLITIPFLLPVIFPLACLPFALLGEKPFNPIVTSWCAYDTILWGEREFNKSKFNNNDYRSNKSP